MTLTELFESFQESPFRLETLQHYVLAEDEPRRQAIQEGRPLPPWAGRAESIRMVRDAVAAGRRVHRVHVVDLPLSDSISDPPAVERYRHAFRLLREAAAFGNQAGTLIRELMARLAPCRTS